MKAARSRVGPHDFNADPDVPADHRDRQRCKTCGVMGAAGDARHPTARPAGPPRPRPLPPELAAAAAARDAAILGEHDDE